MILDRAPTGLADGLAISVPTRDARRPEFATATAGLIQAADSPQAAEFSHGSAAMGPPLTAAPGRAIKQVEITTEPGLQARCAPCVSFVTLHTLQESPTCPIRIG